jgi:hypothetical protein
MNHFEYLRETSVHTNDDKQRTYKERGGIDMRFYPFDLRDETWGELVKHLAQSSEGSHQASSLLLTKKKLPKILLKIPQLLLLQKVISVQFKHAHGIKPTLRRILCVQLKE